MTQKLPTFKQTKTFERTNQELGIGTVENETVYFGLEFRQIEDNMLFLSFYILRIP